jgi:hypothetical protein
MRNHILAACFIATASSAAQPPAVQKALSLPGVAWSKRTTPNAIVYARTGTPLARQLGALGADTERAIATDLAWLRAPTAGFTLHVFLVGSREEMRTLTGQTFGGNVAIEDGVAYAVANDSVRPALRHEIMHVLSWRLWGAPAGGWMSEGIATVVARCGGYDLSDLVASLSRAGKFVPLEQLRQDFNTMPIRGEKEGARYLQAASLLSFIDEKYGRDRLRAVWSNGALRNVRQTLGVDMPTLERQWQQHVAQIDARTPAPPRWADVWNGIATHGCE